MGDDEASDASVVPIFSDAALWCVTREMEKQRQQREAEDQRRAAELKAKEEEQRLQALAARRELDKLRTSYALRVYGDVSLGPAVSHRVRQTEQRRSRWCFSTVRQWRDQGIDIESVQSMPGSHQI